MNMIDTINNFVDAMISEKTQFETMKSEVSQKEETVSVLLDELERREEEIITSLTDRNASSKDESIKAIFILNYSWAYKNAQRCSNFIDLIAVQLKNQIVVHKKGRLSL